MKKLRLLLIILVLFVNIGCDSETEESDEVRITYMNGDTEPVHMWITGRNISPGNKYLPGEMGGTTYYKSGPLLGGSIELEYISIYAGRNGSVLTSYRTAIYPETLKLRFIWDGNSFSKR